MPPEASRSAVEALRGLGSGVKYTEYKLDFIQFREGVKGSGDAEQMHERKLG